MDFKDDTPLGNPGGFITVEEFDRLINKDVTIAKQLNMKKLCRWFDKYNNDFTGIRISKLNNEIEYLDPLKINIFNIYFYGSSLKQTAIETGLTQYKVKQILNEICNHLTQVDGILIRQ